MVDGWVKLWRKSIDTGLIKNHNVWIFWTYCLMKANHKKDYKQVVGFQEIILQPGQFIFGRKKAAEETWLSEQKIRTCLSFLKKCKNLTIKTTNKFSIITIINWDTYQNKESVINQQSNQHVTNRQPTSNHKQEHKNKRKEIYTEDFETIWKAYPRKIGKSKGFQIYKKIKEPIPSLQIILDSIKIQSKSEQWENEKYIPHFTTWLNQRRWEDELEPINGNCEIKIKSQSEIDQENKEYGI